MQHVRAELPAVPRSVRTARALVERAVQDWGLPHLRDTAALVVTELATNAVLHAGPTLLVEVSRTRGSVRVAVSDTSPVLPQRKRRGAEAGTGRGLGLVELLSSGWGAQPRADGPWRKRVWCELPTDPSALPAPDEGALLASA